MCRCELLTNMYYLFFLFKVWNQQCVCGYWSSKEKSANRKAGYREDGQGLWNLSSFQCKPVCFIWCCPQFWDLLEYWTRELANVNKDSLTDDILTKKKPNCLIHNKSLSQIFTSKCSFSGFEPETCNYEL